MNGRAIFRNTLLGKNSGRPPFVPFVYGLAARMAGVPLREMAWNASYEGHCANFVKTGVAAGTKTVKIEYRSGSFHNVELGPRSMIVIVNLH